MKRKLASAFLAAGLSIAAAGCGDGGPAEASGETVQVDVGTDTPIELPDGKLRVGFFTLATTESNLARNLQSLEQEVEELGWDLKVYDSNFDSATQLDQIQNAIQRKEIDAAVVMPVDGQVSCNVITEDFAGANILAVVQLTPICGGEKTDGPGTWKPGILTYIGGIDNVPVNRVWFDTAVEMNPGPQKVVIVGGPAIGAQAIAVDTALKEWQADNPDSEFEVIQTIETDYSTADAAEKTRAFLQANPDTTLVMSVSSPDLTRGVVQAVQEVDRLGDITIVDQGAKQFTLDQIMAGNVQFSVVSSSMVNLGAYSIQAIKDAQDGKEVPTYIDDLAPDSSNTDPVIVTADNAADINPEN
jgi:ABC-type sugar transport system substrate-binding protein